MIHSKKSNNCKLDRIMATIYHLLKYKQKRNAFTDPQYHPISISRMKFGQGGVDVIHYIPISSLPPLAPLIPNLSPTTVNTGVLDLIKRCISPVQPLSRVVDGDAIGPGQVSVVKNHPVLTIHRGSFDLGRVAPVRPVHVPERVCVGECAHVG